MVRHVRAVGPVVPYWDLIPVTTPTPDNDVAVFKEFCRTVSVFWRENVFVGLGF